MGIPDLCGQVVSSPVETTVIAQLCEMYPTATFKELALARLSAYFTATDFTVEKLCQHFIRYSLEMRARGQRFHRMFQNELTQHLSAPHLGLALDIGCGTGAGLAALAPEFEHVVGLDIRMSSLIVAKKLIESEGLTNITLVRGTALRLPFPDRVFDYTMTINVLEHVFEPARMLKEVHRVLAVGGVFAGDSRNRFDLFFPEPHVELRWVGFLPRRWMAPYVRWRVGVSYDHTHLLSFGDLQRALQAVFGREWRIVIPETSYDDSASEERKTGCARRIAPLYAILMRLLPTHLALARRRPLS